MNLSERIRSCLSSPKTAADVHSIIGGDLALIRGCIQQMVKVGLLQRIGEARPYRYKVARQLKQQNRGFALSKIGMSQRIRDALKSGNKRPFEIAAETGDNPQRVAETMRELVKGGFVEKVDFGEYRFLRDPVKKTAMSKKERLQRQAEYRQRKAEEAGREYAPNPRKARKTHSSKQYTVIKPKEVVEMGSFQTVDDWLKDGGVIDRSPTIPKFERLTAEDIAKFKYRPRSAGTISGGRSYLSG